MELPKAIVLDIEGTTTPISFVYDTLFPYARTHVGEFLRRNAQLPEVREDLRGLSAQAAEDARAGLEGAQTFAPDDVEAAVRNVEWQMDSDRKTTALKSLQGKIWRAGYEAGELRGTVFADVPRALEAWRQAGVRIAIYSSGSVEAQKLLFGNSVAGDLTPHIEAYFDTRTGPKREPTSYEAIAGALDLPPGDILFATDVLEEAEAARHAGFRTVVMLRPGNHATAPHDHPTLESFDDLR